MKTDRGVKEWSAVIDALGNGQQIVLIRKREPKQKDLLLFPTFNYYQKNLKTPEVFDSYFQDQYRAQARRSAEACMKYAHEDLLADVGFYAHVEEVIAVSDKRAFDAMKDSFIWTPDHVKEYAASAASGTLYVWILRVYKLPHVARASRTGGGIPDLYKHYEEVDLAGSKPVISDDEFERKKSKLLSILKVKAAI